RQSLRPPRRRNEPEASLGQADPYGRAVGRDPRIARERQLEPAAERGPGDRRDGRERKRREVVQHLLHRAARLLGFGLRGSAQKREVGAGHELAGLTARDHQTAWIRVTRLGDGGGEILEK